MLTPGPLRAGLFPKNPASVFGHDVAGPVGSIGDCDDGVAHGMVPSGLGEATTACAGSTQIIAAAAVM